jgi:hypothetical protein
MNQKSKACFFFLSHHLQGSPTTGNIARRSGLAQLEGDLPKTPFSKLAKYQNSGQVLGASKLIPIRHISRQLTFGK